MIHSRPISLPASQATNMLILRLEQARVVLISFALSALFRLFSLSALFPLFTPFALFPLYPLYPLYPLFPRSLSSLSSLPSLPFSSLPSLSSRSRFRTATALPHTTNGNLHFYLSQLRVFFHHTNGRSNGNIILYTSSPVSLGFGTRT